MKEEESLDAAIHEPVELSRHDPQWFMRWANGRRRTHHLHVVVHAEVAWRERIAFREALRADSDLARRYEALKQVLAEMHREDREAYTGDKTTFIRTTLAAGGFMPALPGSGLFRR